MKNIVTVVALVLISVLSVVAQSGTSLGVQQTLPGSLTVIENTSRPMAVIAADPASKEVTLKTEAMVLVPLEYLTTLTSALASIQAELSEIKEKVGFTESNVGNLTMQVDDVKRHLTTVLGTDSYNRLLDGTPCGSRLGSNFPNHPILCLLERTSR